MPTYSYRCTECDTAFDIHQAFTDNALTECPACAGKLRKVYTSIGVTFNGSGFYRTDSRQTSSSSDKSSSDKSSAKSGDKAATSSPSASSSASSTATPSSTPKATSSAAAS